MKKLVISMLLAMSTSSAVATEGDTSYTISPTELKVAEKKSNVADFGQQVAVMVLSYVKDVREVDGKSVVDVVVVNKLCHVTVIEHDSGLKAEKVACDAGDYYENRDN
ncbi:TPA: hypothetical protein ACMDS2_003476 [Vibrio parahaemolyticus]|uniref:hypothetical protein n=1 Tax=Vibrio parahaemolyticus TaxID=670 RepID=UPI001D805E30|nr:hypothetical protein [Vibrio parahaemolyticus]EJG0471969.1 hypothetical protein [Vibrio parahaemolyticus]